ncbi:MAG: DEAD/DEAH box helicase, partial [Methylococcaceae bacterium]|nr:DEAD/DEAH box helicase [Methylococcaceae bacterium]
MGFEHPTPVQEQAIPPSLAYKDLLVSAKTGSGKTVAFLLPMLQRLLSSRSTLFGTVAFLLPMLQRLLSSRSTLFGTRALILAPTRELARQTYDQCLQLIEFTELKVGLITGGEDFKQHQSLLRRNFEIIIATPGRLLELMNQESGDFSHLEVLVLDEADRMLDMGFSDDVLSIVSHCNAARQTLLFSATLTHFGVIKI